MMKRSAFLLLIIMALVALLVLSSVAGTSGKACTKVVNPEAKNRSCISDGGDKDVFRFAYTLCEKAAKAKKCDDQTPKYCRMIVLQYIDEGNGRCRKIEEKCWQSIHACSGHAPPTVGTWVEDGSLL